MEKITRRRGGEPESEARKAKSEFTKDFVEPLRREKSGTLMVFYGFKVLFFQRSKVQKSYGFFGERYFEVKDLHFEFCSVFHLTHIVLSTIIVPSFSVPPPNLRSARQKRREKEKEEKMSHPDSKSRRTVTTTAGEECDAPDSVMLYVPRATSPEFIVRRDDDVPYLFQTDGQPHILEVFPVVLSNLASTMKTNAHRLTKLHTLCFQHWKHMSKKDVAHIATILRSTLTLSNLKRLTFMLCNISARKMNIIAQAIHESGHLHCLESLSFRSNRFSVGLAEMLKTSPHLASLQELDLSCNGITSSEVKILADNMIKATHLVSFRSLNLSANPTIGDEGIEHLCRMFRQAPHLRGMKNLNLAFTDLSNVGLSILTDCFSSIPFHQLESLDIDMNRYDEKSLHPFLKMMVTSLPHLSTFSGFVKLSGCQKLEFPSSISVMQRLDDMVVFGVDKPKIVKVEQVFAFSCGLNYCPSFSSLRTPHLFERQLVRVIAKFL